MSQTSWRWVSLLSACAAVSPAALRAQAAADIVIEHGERVIPADGGLLVLVPTVSRIGAGAMAVPAQIEVTESDRPVAGETREIGWIEDLTALSLGGSSVVGVGLVWTPAAPLVPGKRYVVRAALVGGDVQSAQFEAGDAWQPARPELALDATLEVLDLGDDETHCCARFLDGSGHEGCFVARYAERPALATSLSSEAPEEQLRQFVYLYRAYAQADGETIWASGFRTYDSALPYVPFLTPVADYCVEVRARHIVTDETFSYSRCVPASQLTEPLHDPASEIEAGLRIEHCSVPQYGDLLQWCQLNADACRGAGNADCALYDTLCQATLTDALAILLDMEDERERRSAAARDAGGEDAATPADAADEAASGDDAGGCGCRAAPGSGANSHGGAALLVLVALAGRALARALRRG